MRVRTFMADTVSPTSTTEPGFCATTAEASLRASKERLEYVSGIPMQGIEIKEKKELRVPLEAEERWIFEGKGCGGGTHRSRANRKGSDSWNGSIHEDDFATEWKPEERWIFGGNRSLEQFYPRRRFCHRMEARGDPDASTSMRLPSHSSRARRKKPDYLASKRTRISSAMSVFTRFRGVIS